MDLDILILYLVLWSTRMGYKNRVFMFGMVEIYPTIEEHARLISVLHDYE